MRYISEHISWAEATHSNTAKDKEIENIPNDGQIVAMKKIAKEVFEPLRTWANEPIRVNSFYRSPLLCEAIKSKTTSQHTKGQAIDIDATGKKTNADLFNYIKDFVGVSGNRKKVLKAVKKNRKISYHIYA